MMTARQTTPRRAWTAFDIPGHNRKERPPSLRMQPASGRLPTLVAIAASLVSNTVYVDCAQASSVLRVDIPAGRAVDSINELGREAGLQILYNYDGVKLVETPAVKGSLEPLEALRQLLVGTGLTFKRIDGDTLFIYPLDQDQAPQKQDKVAEGTGSFTQDEPGGAPGPVRPPDVVPAKPATIVIKSRGIHGLIPNLTGVDQLEIEREDIETSGVTTIPDLVATLPQNCGAGPNENTVRGSEAETNSSSGSGINLRCLGDGASLVLVNRHRLAPSGTVGGFTDIANLPLAAVDTMEVIPEGTTARWGVDAIGGLVNFSLRQDTGAETRAEVGGLAGGAVYHELFDQSYGWRWATGHLFTLFEYYERDALPVNQRRLATSNLAPLGGEDFDIPYGNPGTIQTYSPTTGYTLWAIPHGQTGASLNATQFTSNTENPYNVYDGYTLLPRQERSNFVLSGEQQITGASTAFLDVLLGRRLVHSTRGGEILGVSVPNSNPYYVNPAGGDASVTVLYNFGRDLGPVITDVDVNSGQITTGVDIESGAFGHLELYTSFAYERQHQTQNGLVNLGALANYLNDADSSSALNVFGDGTYTNPKTLAALRARGELSLNSRLESAGITIDRALFHASGGDAVLTLGEDYRRQFLQSVVSSATSFGPALPYNLGRVTLSTFAQADLPLVSHDNSLKGIEALTLSAALRYEHYSDVEAVTAPQYAVAWHPIKEVLLRGTWARLSHAPELPDLDETNNVSVFYPLQRTDGTYTQALIVAGNNSALKPEVATSWTAGIDIEPAGLQGLSTGLTYFHTDFANRISDPLSLPANVLQNAADAWLLPPVTTAARGYICAHSQFQGTVKSCLTEPIGAIVDLRLQNVARLDTQGVDVAARYELNQRAGQWKFGLNATYLFQYTEQPTPSSPSQELVSTVHNPIDLRLRASLAWSYRGLWAKSFLNFQNSYKDNSTTPPRSIGSWTTVTAAAGYNLHLGRSGSSEQTQFSVSADNLFNHMLPFVNNQYGIGYDQENASLLGRVISFSVRQKW
jgi:iron complex outermembrane receptor protein